MQTFLKSMPTTLLCFLFLFSSCKNKPTDDQPPKAEPEPSQLAKDKVHDDHDHVEGHEHSGQEIPPVKLPPNGKLGEPFTLEKETPINEILSNPKKFDGKKVLVTGKVEAQCKKRRRWFALSHEDKRPWLRISTEPKFAIHATAEGMRGKAEGVVKIQKVSVAEAKHLAKAHRLFGGDASKINEPQYLPIIKATGAQFTNK